MTQNECRLKEWNKSPEPASCPWSERAGVETADTSSLLATRRRVNSLLAEKVRRGYASSPERAARAGCFKAQAR